jgi:flagellar biosynthesis chaperone FliJ
MAITTEEAELLLELGKVVPDGSRRIATAISTLAAERDALRAKVERPESGVSYEAFVSAMQIVTIERDALRAEKVNLQDDLASVERERAHQQGRADRNAAEYAREQKKREQLQAENARLRKALDFYGDFSKYPAPFTGGMGALWEDCGKIARAALGETQ